MVREAERVYGVLAQVAPFSALGEAHRAWMAARCRVRRLVQGELLLGDGQVLTHAYILTAGSLGRSLVTADGKKVLLNFTLPTTVFCCASAIDGSAHIGLVEANEASEVVSVPVDAILHALEESAAFSLAMARSLARSSVRQTEAIRELMFPVPVRLARLVCRLADEEGSVDLAMSKATLAEMLATVPETLSRALAVLRAQGLVETGPRSVRILDRAALQAYAQL